MAKVTCDFEFGDSVIVVLRPTVNDLVELADGSVEVITNHGRYHSEDPELIGVFPDPED